MHKKQKMSDYQQISHIYVDIFGYQYRSLKNNLYFYMNFKFITHNI